ncbi:MAG: nucleoid occlusion factor SlmA [Pseudomonadota bacterium]
MPERRDRKRQILEAFLRMLEEQPGGRITTASLAAEVGVSEAALYRHFPSKAKMIDGLLEFAEDTMFPLITRVLVDETEVERRCYHITTLVLTFVERNPGFGRLFVGDALMGETERLRTRVRQLFERLETQLRQVIREAQAVRTERSQYGPNDIANLMLSAAEGRILQFVRSDFKSRPTDAWQIQWQILARSLTA